ncbi:Short-chain dehydrogenase/reductase SDR (plasmid) [Acidisarcina polymorpha]|uniref:Short-chain dehydrogenase/reductase SDR n=1 Tax=Acidisarcina polymorpha TaxID=2211140 RepID=A0A2Z5GAP1_9BACT|nr:SDR family oxidoreductase [Acidisarcina polymorpha]AXC16273.1 Short-chain dehydrogenase/reductase SDR [Acidisarcina polymorpha]
MANQKLNGKVALVAGGAKNLGGLVSRELADLGAKVAVHYNSAATQTAADETIAYIEDSGSEAFSIRADLTKSGEIARVFDETINRFGGIDVAVNTTGMVIKKPIEDCTEKDYDNIFAINSKIAFFFMQAAGKKLNERGKIITIVTSLLAAYTDSYAIYPGSKAPIEHFTRAASKEFGVRGISVNSIGPGPMETPFFYGQETKESAAYNQNAAALSKYTKTGLTDLADIAPVVTFLATDGWWITGQTIFANGGYTTR